ncbi:MAG TPA: hypothetical protein VJN65_05260, partial [Bacteroidota bacterium]|nr:hypothetical protein [Bacteroidota bacterium]
MKRQEGILARGLHSFVVRRLDDSTGSSRVAHGSGQVHSGLHLSLGVGNPREKLGAGISRHSNASAVEWSTAPRVKRQN